MNTKWVLAPQLITIQIIVAILLFVTSRILYLRMKKWQRELELAPDPTHLDFGVMHAYGILFALTFMLGCSTVYIIMITIRNGI